MKKVHKVRALKLFLLTLVLLLINGCTNTIVPAPGIVPTEVAIETIAPLASTTQTPDLSTEIPTVTLIPTFTPTPKPPNPYVFVSGNGKQIDLSYGPIVITFDEGSLAGEVILVNLTSPQNLGDYGSTSEALTAGNGVGVIRPENYGNLLLSVHSGYINNKPLQGEMLRKFLEYWGQSDTKYILKRLAEIAGSKGTLFTSDGSVKVEIVGGVRLQHAESEELWLNPEVVLDIATKKDAHGFLAIGNPQIFENIKTDSHEILINFCGWGPNQIYSYYRYVILLNVIEQP